MSFSLLFQAAIKFDTLELICSNMQHSDAAAEAIFGTNTSLHAEDVRRSVKHQAKPPSCHCGDGFVLLV